MGDGGCYGGGGIGLGIAANDDGGGRFCCDKSGGDGGLGSGACYNGCGDGGVGSMTLCLWEDYRVVDRLRFSH